MTNNFDFYDNKEQYLKLLKNGYISPTYLKDGLLDDEKFQRQIFKLAPQAIEHLNKLHDDKEIMLELVEIFPELPIDNNSGDKLRLIAYKYASESLKKDKDFRLAVLKYDGSVIGNIYDEDEKFDRDYILASLRCNDYRNEPLLNYGGILERFINEILADEEIVKEFHKKDGGEKVLARARVTTSTYSGKRWVNPEGHTFESLKEQALSILPIVGSAWKKMGEKLRNDRDVVMAALKGGAKIYDDYHYDLPQELLEDEEIIMLSVKNGENVFDKLPDQYKEDKEFVKSIIKEYGENVPLFHYLPEWTRADREIVLSVVKHHCDRRELGYASSELRNDREVVLTAVKSYGGNLQYASDELKNDKELVLMAVKQDWRHLEYASNELMGDKEFMMPIIKGGGVPASTFRELSEELRADKDVAIAAVSIDMGSIEYVSLDLKSDRDVVMAAANKKTKQWTSYFSRDLGHVHNKFYSDKEIMAAAAETDVTNLKFMPPELASDREFIIELIKLNGFSLYYASDELKNDKELVLLAIDNLSGSHKMYFGGGESNQFYNELSEELQKDITCIIRYLKKLNEQGMSIPNDGDDDDEYVKFFADYSQNKMPLLIREIVKREPDLIYFFTEKQLSLTLLAMSHRDKETFIYMFLKGREEYGNSNYIYTYAEPEFKGDKELIMKLLSSVNWERRYDERRYKWIEPKIGEFLAVMPDEIKHKASFWREAISLEPLTKEHIPAELFNDKEELLAMIEVGANYYNKASKKLKEDIDFTLEALSRNAAVISYVSDEFRNQKEIILATIKKDGKFLGYASDDLKKDKEVVLVAMRQNKDAIRSIHKSLLNTRELDFVKELVSEFGDWVIEYTSKAVRKKLNPEGEAEKERKQEEERIAMEAAAKAAAKKAKEEEARRINDEIKSRIVRLEKELVALRAQLNNDDSELTLKIYENDLYGNFYIKSRDEVGVNDFESTFGIPLTKIILQLYMMKRQGAVTNVKSFGYEPSFISGDIPDEEILAAIDNDNFDEIDVDVYEFIEVISDGYKDYSFKFDLEITAPKANIGEVRDLFSDFDMELSDNICELEAI